MPILHKLADLCGVAEVRRKTRMTPLKKGVLSIYAMNHILPGLQEGTSVNCFLSLVHL